MNDYDTLFQIVTNGSGWVFALDEQGEELASAELPELDADDMDRYRRACRQVVAELSARAWTALDAQL